ncbi:MAG TPA: hypothetical protein VMT52_00730 [Planctomycetota bacterium]|nr:hypothetical protein [Planctomycetota bacterium]
MSAVTLPPPPPAVCLTRSYASRKIKGGTVIAEDVLDLETHRKRLADPGAYRTAIGACWACGTSALHAHCFRERVLRPASVKEAAVTTTVRLFRCSRAGCGAVFTVLPLIIARHLWRLWKTVEDAATEKLEVPKSTRRRWLGRLRSSGSQLVQTLTSKASSLLSGSFRSALARVATRGDLVETFRSSLAERVLDSFAPLSAWIHRLEPGIRLM